MKVDKLFFDLFIEKSKYYTEKTMWASIILQHRTAAYDSA